MRNLKRVLALALALVMMLGMMITANAASYADEAAINEDYAVAVEVLSDMGVFRGQGTGFAPKATLTRAEAAALIYRVLTADVKDSKIDLYDYSSFDDVAEGNWATGYITYAANGGYVKGDGTGNFLPTAQVTGIQVLAIMLRAMGYGQNGEFEGAAWKDNVLTTADDLGLLDNVAANDLDKAASRELVAQLIWDAIQAPTTSYTPALGYGYDLGVKGASLGEKKFGLTPAKYTDNWGCPYTGWTYTTGEKATYFENKHVAYTTKVAECQISEDMFKGENKTGLVAYVNGVKQTATYTIEATDVYTKLGAQGRLTKVYADRIVMIDTMLAKVTNVTPATYDTAGHQINPSKLYLDVYSTDVSAATTHTDLVLESKTNWEYTKGQYVLGWFETGATNDLFGGHGTPVNNNEGEIKAVAESFTGNQTVLHYYDGMRTIDGATYAEANCYHLNEAGISTAKFTWFKDLYGNVIGSAVIPTTYSYGTIKNIQWFTQAGIYGYAQATMTMMDGTDKSIVVKAIADKTDTAAAPLSYAYTTVGVLASGTVSTEIKNNYADYAGNDLYRIADNGDGTYTLVDVSNTLVGGTETTTAVVTGSATMGGIVVDSATKYLYRTVTALADDAGPLTTYTAVTGFNNVPTFTNATVDYVDYNNDGRADLVYIVGIPASAKSAGLFYLGTNSHTQVVMTETGAVNYYVLNGYYNGVAGTIKVKAADASIVTDMMTAGANVLYDVKVENGFVVAYDAIDYAANGLHGFGAGYKGAYTGKTAIRYVDAANNFSSKYANDVLVVTNTTTNAAASFNVTNATRVYGTLVEDVAYTSDKYVLYVVYDAATLNAVEIYCYEIVPGTDYADPNTPANVGNILREVKVYQGGTLIATKTYLQENITAGTYTTGQDYTTVSGVLADLVVTDATVITDASTVVVTAGQTTTVTYIVTVD